MNNTTVLQMDNPLITQSRAMTLWSELRQLPAYMPSEVKWRGDPACEPGDILAFEDTLGHTTKHIITSQTMHFGGGFYADSTSDGEATTLKELSSNTVMDKEIAQAKNEIKEEVAQETKALEQGLEAMSNRIDAIERQISSAVADASTAATSAAEALKTAKEASVAVKQMQGTVAALKTSVETLEAKVKYIPQSHSRTIEPGGAFIVLHKDGAPNNIMGLFATADGSVVVMAGQTVTLSGLKITLGTNDTYSINGADITGATQINYTVFVGGGGVNA